MVSILHAEVTFLRAKQISSKSRETLLQHLGLAWKFKVWV